MVLVAGIILATSNYEFIGDTFKVLLLALISVVFMLLSIVSALFIKIRSTTKSYLLISLVLVILKHLVSGLALVVKVHQLLWQQYLV